MAVGRWPEATGRSFRRVLPTGGATMRDRAARIAKGGLDAAGFVRSPFTVGGKQRLFAEPPHMQASMLFLPAGAPVPAVGDEVDVQAYLGGWG